MQKKKNSFWQQRYKVCEAREGCKEYVKVKDRRGVKLKAPDLKVSVVSGYHYLERSKLSYPHRFFSPLFLPFSFFPILSRFSFFYFQFDYTDFRLTKVKIGKRIVWPLPYPYIPTASTLFDSFFSPWLTSTCFFFFLFHLFLFRSLLLNRFGIEP